MKEEDIQSVSPSSAKSPTGLAKIRLLGSLHRTANSKETDAEFVDVPNRLGNILDVVEKKYQVTIRRDSTLILVNGVEARALGDLETTIFEGDDVVFVPMFHGG